MIDKGNKIFCFTDADLDGAGSYLMLHWLSNINIPYKIASISNFRETFLNWLKVNKITDYDQIYILNKRNIKNQTILYSESQNERGKHTQM